jgi:hypothetical protein
MLKHTPLKEELIMTLKERKEIKSLMTRISNAASTIKRAAHEFKLDEDSHVQMYGLTILTDKAKVLMETLKPVQPDDTIQGVVLDLDPEVAMVGRVVITPNGTESEEQEVASGE